MTRLPLLLLPLLLVACEIGLHKSGGGDDPDGTDSGEIEGDSLPDTTDSETHDPDDLPPVADAGDDLVVAVDVVVGLDGAGSYDPEDEALAYRWEIDSLPSGSSVTLVNDSFVDPMFIPDLPGEYLIDLVVNDGAQDSTPDQVSVLAEPTSELPVANAGNNQQVEVGDSVRLDGSASYDPGGEPLSYAWAFTSVPSGSAAALSNPASVSPSFTADLTGRYEIELVVSDSTSHSDPDATTITASEESSDDCGFGCAREAEIALKRRLGGSALVFFPLFFGWRLRRREPLG